MTLFVKLDLGVVVQSQPYAEPGFVEAPDNVVCGMLFDGETYSNPPPVELPPGPKQLSVLISNLRVDGMDVAAVGVDNGMSFAFFVSETEIMAFFVTPIDDMNYGWNVSSTIGTAHVTARDEYSLTITVADTVEPYDMSVQIYRFD